MLQFSDGPSGRAEGGSGAELGSESSKPFDDCGNAAYTAPVQAVIETPDYLADARAAGLTDTEREAIVDFIATHPAAGDLIAGTGGARKIQFAGRSKGKSGGYRIITYYGCDDIRCFCSMCTARAAR